ncbi:MAG: hypothetical protein KatS3mg026_0737 [Bacteroidia bacterium]|nr:MAG: hypothetical protein KatS3mg026_0737 [Bacteroidia bacterium]
MRKPKYPKTPAPPAEAQPSPEPLQEVSQTLAQKIAQRQKEIQDRELRRIFYMPHLEPHHSERVAFFQGVLYINDSAATTPRSVWDTLQDLERPVVWIAGGLDKGNDWGEILPLVQARVKALVLIGANPDRLLEAFQPVIPTLLRATSMEDAVEKAYTLAKPGDVVLLSPGCPSFDWFESYEARGNAFREAVLRLSHRLSE